MEDGRRRSGRVRKQIKTLAEEQAEAAELAAANLPIRSNKRKAKRTVNTEIKDDDEEEEEEEPRDHVKNGACDELREEYVENEPLSDFEHADDESIGTVFDDEQPSPPKKRKKAVKKLSALKDGKQRYNAPSEGTSIPW
jgi:hypothetical protein